MLLRLGAVLLFALSSSMASANQLVNIEWLVGHWVASSPAGIYESWFSTSSGEMMIGMAKMTSADRSRIYFNEYDQIQEVGGQLRLQPFPNGERGVTFDATFVSSTKVIFENKNHPFPNRITYELSADARHLTLTVEGQDISSTQFFVMEARP